MGTFDLELDPPLNLSLLSFDVVSTPSTPEVSVGVSETGVTFSPASSLALNGYRINAWLVPATVRFVRLVISPTHPDTLGGSVYTFGLTSVSGWTIDFHLRSEWVSKPVLARPHSLFWKFLADSDPGLSYFLSLGTQAAQQVSPGDVVSVPGVSSVVQSPVALDSSGLLSYALPGDGALALHRRVCHHPVPLPPESLEHGPEPLSIRLRRESRAGGEKAGKSRADRKKPGVSGKRVPPEGPAYRGA